jgi:outer membrane protein insertion porin family
VTTEEGEWYDASAVEESLTDLSEAAGERGFAFVDIRPKGDRDRESRTITLTYEIREGPRVYVERIDIEGNIRTLDRVIRREFRLVEGDAFNTSLLRRSRKRIQNLGFFQSVEMVNVPGSAPDRTVVTVDVEEQATGDLAFGLGFSSAVGPLGTVSLRERNLLGRGQDLRLGFTLSGNQTQLDLSFTEPYFLERNVSAGFDLFRVITEQDESSFDREAIGGSLRAGYNLSENLRQVLRYTLEFSKISNVDSGASSVIKADQGEDIESSIGQTLTFDTRDARFDPREGYVARLGNTLAGLGGDVRYIKTTLGGSYHYPVFEDVTATVAGEVGNITGLADDTRASDRFFIGGSSLRGFEFAGIGPRDTDGGDALGGKHYYTGTLELSFPVGLPEELNVRGRVFTDVGSLWDLDNSSATVVDENSMRASVGVGFSWLSPFGPIVIDFGFPVMKEDFDNTESVTFSFGTRF